MKKTTLMLITGILTLFLVLNLTILSKIENQTNQIHTLRNEFYQLENQLNHISMELNQMVAEKEWIQNTNFALVKERSRADRMVVRGEWTFNEIRNDQKPIFYYREQGTTVWTKEALESLGGLNYAVEITLSPEKHYEYQISAEGEVSTGTNVLTIPPHIYGFPEKKVDISFSSIKDSSNRDSIIKTAEIYIGFGFAPLEEMRPASVTFQIERDAQVAKTFSLINTSNSSDQFSGSWEMNDQDKALLKSDTKFYIITEFKNGVILKEETKVIRELINEEQIRSGETSIRG